MLWIVIAVLVTGGSIITIMLVHKTDDLRTTNSNLNGDVSSLRRQVQELRAIVSPSPSATPTESSTPPQ